jgi:transcription-repair coupling factor (superfamily II helicase)
VILDEAAIARFRQNYRISLWRGGDGRPAVRGGQRGPQASGDGALAAVLPCRLETLFDYLPDASVVLDDQVTAARLARWEGIDDSYDARRGDGGQGADRHGLQAGPGRAILYLDDAAWEAAVAGHRVVQLSPLPQSPGPGVLDAGARAGAISRPSGSRKRSIFSGPWPIMFKRSGEGGQVVIASWSEGARERLKGLLADNGLTGARRSPISATCPRARAGCSLSSGRWRRVSSPRVWRSFPNRMCWATG